MDRKIFFMSGLPRSGSTLLKSILNQNKSIYCGPNSPVYGLMYETKKFIKNNEQFKCYPKPNQENLIISSIFENYYSDIKSQCIIDLCRAWPNNIDFIEKYIIKNPKIICVVRDINEILTSFIMLTKESNKKISFIDEYLIKSFIEINDINRCEFLMSECGVVGKSLNSLKNGIQKYPLKNFHFVEYDNLINNPHETIKNLYDYLELELYNHNFSQIKSIYTEYDEEICGIKSLHKISNKLHKKRYNPANVLNQSIIDKYSKLEFWRSI